MCWIKFRLDLFNKEEKYSEGWLMFYVWNIYFNEEFKSKSNFEFKVLEFIIIICIYINSLFFIWVRLNKKNYGKMW